jgi:hypothetical protein
MGADAITRSVSVQDQAVKQGLSGPDWPRQDVLHTCCDLCQPVRQDSKVHALIHAILEVLPLQDSNQFCLRNNDNLGLTAVPRYIAPQNHFTCLFCCW